MSEFPHPTRGRSGSSKPPWPPDTIARAASRVLADPSYPAAAARLGQAGRRDASSGALLRELEALPAAEPAP